MIDHAQYTTYPGSATPLGQLWSAHLDALDRHLSVNTWALLAVSVVLIAYPIMRILLPGVLHGIVLPDVVRTVLNLIRI
jgi:hypothetical protein